VDSLTKDMYENKASIGSILDELVHDTEAITALVISRQGICLGQSGTAASLNSTALAALVAGMFSATKEVANIVGEDQFSILLQQGEKRHIHISLIGARSMMVVVFEDYSRIGKVRYAARGASSKLVQALEKNEKKREEVAGSFSVPDFKEYAMNLIDRIFVVGEDEDASS
jgi:predicted regulator of Ras-like GTPase activity (Roadblock/LC7/MglB family)